MKLRNMIQIITTDRPTYEESRVIRDGILGFNHRNYGEKPTFFTVVMRDEQGVYGGLTAYCHSDSIFVDVLWVHEDYRGQGYGTKIMQAAEKEARRKGCQYITLDTFDYQAEPFYLKNGFYRIGVIEKYILGHDRIFLRKDLAN